MSDRRLRAGTAGWTDPVTWLITIDQDRQTVEKALAHPVTWDENEPVWKTKLCRDFPLYPKADYHQCQFPAILKGLGLGRLVNH